MRDERIYEIEELVELEDYLLMQNQSVIREKLFTDFLNYAEYKNASDWNKAVRLCECLTIIGWGEHEAAQAVCGIFFNGNPTTCFYNKFREPRFVDAIWSKRKNGFTMEQGRTSYHESPGNPRKQNVDHYSVQEDIQDLRLLNQRNWIPKNPILITRTISNCYESSQALIDSLEKDLQKRLDQEMRPELYGNAINRFVIVCSYSYYDNAHCQTNYIIADEKRKLKQKDFYPQLLEMYSKEEIDLNGYFLRNRYDYGPFKNGKVKVTIHFEKKWSEKTFPEQKAEISQHLEKVVQTTIEKLKKKVVSYNFDLMHKDFLKIVSEWTNKGSA